MDIIQRTKGLAFGSYVFYGTYRKSNTYSLSFLETIWYNINRLKKWVILWELEVR